MAKKKKAPALNKAMTADELENKRIMADRYGMPIGEPEPVDVEKERKRYEAEQKKIAKRRAEAIAEGVRQRAGESGRVGANNEKIAAIEKKKRKAPPTPEEREHRRRAEIAQARAVRYGEMAIAPSGPNATPEQIAERPGAWEEE